MPAIDSSLFDMALRFGLRIGGKSFILEPSYNPGLWIGFSKERLGGGEDQLTGVKLYKYPERGIY